MDKRRLIYLIIRIYVVSPIISLIYHTVKGFYNVNSTMDAVMIGVFTFLVMMLILLLDRLIRYRKNWKVS
jgi:hypothetical protein